MGLAFGLVACSKTETVAGTTVAAVTTAKPLGELDEAETFRFQRGIEEFTEVDTAAEGLGPLFNGASCSHCHSLGGLGGGGVLRVSRSVCVEADGSTSDPPGGSLIHLFSTRPDVAVAAPPFDCERRVVQRRSTALFGAGLLEAVSDGTLSALAKSQPEPIRGRVAIVKDIDSGKERVGRLGWKAQHSSLRAFAGDAYRNELGITNELFPGEIAPGGDASLLESMDPVPDPEATVGAIDRLADFMRMLAPVAPLKKGPIPHFEEVGCSGCHTPELRIEKSVFGVTSAKAYTDLLLHDIGTGDGVAQGDALAGEFRTAPLWGLRHAPNYLHDGRANTVEEAIAAHAGQADASREAFFGLSKDERRALLLHLQSL